MTTSAVLRVTATARLTGPTGTLDLQLVSGSRLGLDEEWSPFAQGTLVAAFADVADISAFDPRTPLRATVQLASDSYRQGTLGDVDLYFAQHGITTLGQFDAHFGAGTTPADIDALFVESLDPLGGNGFGIGDALFDLVVTAIDIDPRDGTATLTVQSDEILLHEYLRVATTAYVPTSTNILETVNTTLALIGATPIGATDITVEGATLHTDDFETASAFEWLAGSFGVLDVDTAQHHSGTRSLRATNTLPIPAFGAYVTRRYDDLAAGRQNNASIWVYTATPRKLTLSLRDPVTNISGSGGDLVASAGWRQLVASYAPTTPALIIEVQDAVGGVAGNVVYLDEFVVTRTPYQINTGALTVPVTALTWEPGRSAWDYVAAPLRSVGLRLWCDERRRWRLTQPHAYSRNNIPGYGSTIVDAPDTVTISSSVDRDDPGWFDAAVLTYQWTDTIGAQQRATDAFALDGWTKAYAETIDQPFPGVGAAEQLVRRAAGRGRQVPITSILQPRTYPGDGLLLTTPSLPDQIGWVRSVEFDLADATMTISPRDMEDF